MKSIDTLVPDIQNLFTGGHVCDEDNVRWLGEQISQIVSERLRPGDESYRPSLRMSNIGKPDRQLWYQFHPDALGEETEQEKLTASTQIKFLYGHLLEAILLFLAKEAGHTVEAEQAEVELEGVKGHNDAIIDGVVVDVKSASKYAYEKFRNHTLQDNDAFGYMEQLSGYSAGHGNLDGAFLAINKEMGHICLDKYPAEELALYQPAERIKHLKKVVDDPEMPPRCYDPVPDGESGNLKLSVNCSYCPFKQACWSDANDGVGPRTFIYSQGPRHLVHVAKEPKVMEVTF